MFPKTSQEISSLEKLGFFYNEIHVDRNIRKLDKNENKLMTYKLKIINILWVWKLLPSQDVSLESKNLVKVWILNAAYRQQFSYGYNVETKKMAKI